MFRPKDFWNWVHEQVPHLRGAKRNAFASGSWSVFCPGGGYYPSVPYLQESFDSGADRALEHLQKKGSAICCDKCLRELPAFEPKEGDMETRPTGIPHYLRDSRLRSNGMREAAEIVRNFRPASACICGGYISFHNGIPSHQPGCLVGECLEIADEIDARADEIDETPDRWLAELDAAEGKGEGRG
jgi:hypothetical protein